MTEDINRPVTRRAALKRIGTTIGTLAVKAMFSRPGLAIEGVGVGLAADTVIKKLTVKPPDIRMESAPELPPELLPIVSFLERGYPDPRMPTFFVTGEDGQEVKSQRGLEKRRITAIGYQDSIMVNIDNLPYTLNSLTAKPILSPNGKRIMFMGKVKTPSGVTKFMQSNPLLVIDQEYFSKRINLRTIEPSVGRVRWGVGKRGEVYVAEEGPHKSRGLQEAPLYLFVYPDTSGPVMQPFGVPLPVDQARVLGNSTKAFAGDDFQVTLSLGQDDRRTGLSAQASFLGMPEVIDITPVDQLPLVNKGEFRKIMNGTVLAHGTIQTPKLPSDYRHLEDISRVKDSHPPRFNIPALILARYTAEFGFMGEGNATSVDTYVITAQDLIDKGLPFLQVSPKDEDYKVAGSLRLLEQPTEVVSLQLGKYMFQDINLEQLGEVVFDEENKPPHMPRGDLI